MNIRRDGPGATPTGLQCLNELGSRRKIALGVTLALYLAMLSWLGSILQHCGDDPIPCAINGAILLAFAVALPWSLLGLCNGLIGFWLLHFRRDGLAQAAPFAEIDMTGPLTARTAMLMTIRNEDPARAFARMRAMKASVDATGHGELFEWFVLSDSSEDVIAGLEEAEFEAWRDGDRAGAPRLHYRRRMENTGYKAGNIRDFCETWGPRFEFMAPLDADSLMDGATILRLVRIGAAHPQLGILQSLVVGAPATSAFARIFQFGMRHGMRAYTMGAAWWMADCGPFWGHNALVRVAPFTRHCQLPTLSGGRHILSHDQFEAVLMRRAGFEVRALPVECGSFEDNPPTLVDFQSRDLRWCQGNLQYLQLLRTPGLLPLSRLQLVIAIAMFLAAPASTAIIALVALLPVTGASLVNFPAHSAAWFYGLFLLIGLSPKLAGLLDVAMTRGGVARYGGALRFTSSAGLEIVSSLVIGATTSLSASLALIGMLFGRTIGWNGQSRDAHSLGWRTAALAFWPHLVFGLAIFGLGVFRAPSLVLWSLPLTLGYVIAAPFAMATASPRFGLWLARLGLCASPEERREPAILRDLRRSQGLFGTPCRVCSQGGLRPVSARREVGRWRVPACECPS